MNVLRKSVLLCPHDYLSSKIAPAPALQPSIALVPYKHRSRGRTPAQGHGCDIWTHHNVHGSGQCHDVIIAARYSAIHSIETPRFSQHHKSSAPSGIHPQQAHLSCHKSPRHQTSPQPMRCWQCRHAKLHGRTCCWGAGFRV